MKRDTDIWLADLLRAFDALAPEDEDTRSEIARRSGFAWRPRLLDESQLPRELPPPPHRVQPPDGNIRPPATQPPQTLPEFLDGEEEDLPFIEVTVPGGALTEWQNVRPLDSYKPGQGRNALPYLPVFRPEWSRALSATLAAVSLPIGPVDEERLVAAAASGRPTTVIPRKLQWSLALGVQLLLDVGPAMEPFLTDEIHLLELFRETVGPDYVQEARFLDCPSRGMLDGAGLSVYRPPDFGVPVVVVSDVGLGGPARHVNRSRPEEWLDFKRRLAEQESTVVILVPYPAERWPEELRVAWLLIEWDRPTTAGAIRQLIKRRRG